MFSIWMKLLFVIFCKKSTVIGQSQLGSSKYIPKSNIIYYKESSLEKYQKKDKSKSKWQLLFLLSHRNVALYHSPLPTRSNLAKYKKIIFGNLSNFGSCRIAGRSSALSCALACAHFAEKDGTCNAFRLQGIRLTFLCF